MTTTPHGCNESLTCRGARVSKKKKEFASSRNDLVSLFFAKMRARGERSTVAWGLSVVVLHVLFLLLCARAFYYCAFFFLFKKPKTCKEKQKQKKP